MAYSGMPNRRLNLACKPTAAAGIFYHYTSLATLWKILENETLRATQARFSNDSEELKKGAAIMKEVCRKVGDGNALNGYVKLLEKNGGTAIDCYIVCFCGQDDILSQWRGYCRSDGVSIGFAFDEGKPQYYFKNMPKDKQIACNVELYPVWYVEERRNELQCSERVISREQLVSVITAKLKDICQLSGSQDIKAFFDSTIPLIKHVGFCEENEFRLLICNGQLQCGGRVPFPLDSYIEYTEGDEDGIKRPYITLSFGRKDPPNALPIEIETYGLMQRADSELDRLLNCKPEATSEESKREGEKGVTYQVKPFEGEWSRAPQILIGEADDVVQKKVFEAIDRILTADAEREEREQLFKGAKLWCKGHLPIRSIRVSPCHNQKDVIESIKHYCTHHRFWMKYVEVVGSNTPYRRPK